MNYFREQDTEYVWDHFERSVPMSTYLVAMIVASDFDHRTSDPINGVDVRIWARKNAIEQTEYARSIAAKILRYFEVRGVMIPTLRSVHWSSTNVCGQPMN